MVKYAKCPRCELNYIDIEKMQYCEICQKEMKGIIEIDPLDEEEEVETEVCPICGENMMRVGEKMCDECKSKSRYEDEVEPDIDENDDEWRNYLDDDTNDSGVIDIGVVSDDTDEDDEDMEENDSNEEDDDFEYVSADDYRFSEEDDDEDDDDFDDDDDDDDLTAPPKRGRKRKDEDDF